MSRIVLIRGFDGHCHFRQKDRGGILPTAVEFTARIFERAVAMGNTVPAIVTADDAECYKSDINSATPAGIFFEPVMTIMLTRRTTPEIVSTAAKHGVKALKYIPYGVSTNSEESFPLEELPGQYPILETARDCGMFFPAHWESLRDSKGKELVQLDREQAAIHHLDRVVKAFPTLPIIVEHVSTKRMIDYVEQAPKNVWATLTVQHAKLTFMDVCYEDGVIHSPHNYCKPIAKMAEDKAAVVKAMISGKRRYFFGSDAAPHLLAAKLKMPPDAGVFCGGEIALSNLADIFEANNAAGNLNDFQGGFGPDCYGYPRSKEKLELVERSWVVPTEINGIVPFMAGKTLRWKVAD